LDRSAVSYAMMNMRAARGPTRMSMYDRLLALTGIIPPFVLLWYAERFERRIQEPTADWRYRVMAAAGVASIPIAWTERVLDRLTSNAPQPLAMLFNSFIVAASVEEGAKAACVLLLTRGVLAPRTRYGAMLYGLHAAMGFALVENVLAMLQTTDAIAFSTRFFLRAYLTVPMHLVAGGTLGFLWARRRFDRGAVGLFGGLCIAILIHGSFNAALLAVEVLPGAREGLRLTCAGAALAIPLLGVPVLRLFAGALRARDRADDAARGRAPRRASDPVAAPAVDG
jgi:RsiW-degrading membrane proteinase PrsW (M82 family)